MPKGIYTRTKKEIDRIKKLGKKNKGKKFSDKHKEKIGKANKGKTKGRYYPGKGIYTRTEKEIKRIKNLGKANKGKKRSTKHKTQISKANKGKVGYWLGKERPEMIGDKNWSWKGGISSENNKIRNSRELRLWRESVYARDHWTCQKCGDNKGGNLNAHHIQNFANYLRGRTEIANGITFCKKCHKKFHKKYGQQKNTKKQLKYFLNER